MNIYFDIGGTNTRVAAANELEMPGEAVSFFTPKDFNKGIQSIADAAREICNGNKVTALAGGVRGILNRHRSRMAKDPGSVLKEWEDKPLTKSLSEKFDGAPVYIENDAAVVGLGEATYGAGVGHSIVAYHTVSTGFGGARIENGTISRASVGFEPGHQVVDMNESLKGGENSGLIENLISGQALEKRRGVKPYEIEQCDAVWEELAAYLARGLKNTIVFWSPDVIVLGGSMICGKPGIPLDSIVRHTRTLLGDSLPCPKIVEATLNDKGGLYGAMAFLAQCRTADG